MNKLVSLSESLRTRANDLFKSASNESNQKRLDLLIEALKIYNQATTEALTNDESVSALKNVGVCSFEIYK